MPRSTCCLASAAVGAEPCAAAVGTGALLSAPTRGAAEVELLAAVTGAFEEWAHERFGGLVARRARSGRRLEPDLLARFDDGGKRHLLVGELVAGRPAARDVHRLVRMMRRHGASLGLVVALDEPSAAALEAIYLQGTLTLAGGLRAPRIRVVTTRDLVRDDVELLPTRRRPEALELLVA